MTRTSDEIRRAAYHEAAHAVVALLLGESIDRVTIEQSIDEGFDGRTMYVRNNVHNWTSQFGSEDWACMVNAIISYAGHLADMQLGFDAAFEEAGAYGDYYTAMTSLQDICSNNEDRIAELQQQALNTSRMMVELNWSRIELLAEQLQVSMTVSGDEISELMHIV